MTEQERPRWDWIPPGCGSSTDRLGTLIKSLKVGQVEFPSLKIRMKIGRLIRWL